MVFSFSFSLANPGLVNPFTTSTPSRCSISAPSMAGDRDFDKRHPGSTLHPRRTPSPSLLPPLSKKRGWVPSSSEPSHAAAIPTSTIGYLDTPSKYREKMDAAVESDAEIDAMVIDIPPPKRRRTLTGSIVSGAMSAALIGTAVGLTVYRLWKDRSKHPEALPPPPYEQGEWVPPQSEPSTPAIHVPPPTSRFKKSHYPAGRRTMPRHRKTLSRASAYGGSSSSPFGSAKPTSRMAIPSEFLIHRMEEEDTNADVDGQVAWMNDRLAQLIAEGQRALGKEVVVMSEDQEDAEDDGAEGWVEDADEDTPSRTHQRARSSTRRGKQTRSPGLPAYTSPHVSPRLGTIAIPGTGSPRLGREASLESEGLPSTSVREDASAWVSPEMRESMERARERYLQDRACA